MRTHNGEHPVRDAALCWNGRQEPFFHIRWWITHIPDGFLAVLADERQERICILVTPETSRGIFKRKWQLIFPYFLWISFFCWIRITMSWVLLCEICFQLMLAQTSYTTCSHPDHRPGFCEFMVNCPVCQEVNCSTGVCGSFTDIPPSVSNTSAWSSHPSCFQCFCMFVSVLYCECNVHHISSTQKVWSHSPVVILMC